MLLNADLRDGSLRQAVFERGIPMLVYEAGEALRIVDLRHRQGLEKTVDLLTAQGRLDESRAGLIDAGFDVELAQARLLLVTGQLNEESIR